MTVCVACADVFVLANADAAFFCCASSRARSAGVTSLATGAGCADESPRLMEEYSLLSGTLCADHDDEVDALAEFAAERSKFCTGCAWVYSGGIVVPATGVVTFFFFAAPAVFLAVAE